MINPPQRHSSEQTGDATFDHLWNHDRHTECLAADCPFCDLLNSLGSPDFGGKLIDLYVVESLVIQ